MIELLKSHKVLVCVGSGGVGKTSISASIGVLAANSGLRTLVLTIDPAQRLAQALGMESNPGEVVRVPKIHNLSALMIDPHREFDEFVLGAIDRGLAKSLFENRLYQQLVSNLNGSQEFTSLLRLLLAVQSKEYDLIVLDTPPTQNAVDFLRAPDRLYALFQDSVIGWFSAHSEKREGFIKRTLNRGTRMVTAALESITGSTFIHELKDFFTHLSYLQVRVAKVSREVGELLRSADTGFLLVTGFDESKLKEALEFQQDLKSEKLRLCGVILNRWFPEWTQNESLWPGHWDQDPDFVKLKEIHAEFKEYYGERQRAYEKFKQQTSGEIPLVKLPDFKNTVQGIEDLQRLAETIEQKWGSSRE